jgi:hypothetical protein
MALKQTVATAIEHTYQACCLTCDVDFFQHHLFFTHTGLSRARRHWEPPNPKKRGWRSCSSWPLPPPGLAVAAAPGCRRRGVVVERATDSPSHAGGVSQGQRWWAASLVAGPSATSSGAWWGSRTHGGVVDLGGEEEGGIVGDRAVAVNTWSRGGGEARPGCFQQTAIFASWVCVSRSPDGRRPLPAGVEEDGPRFPAMTVACGPTIPPLFCGCPRVLLLRR